MKQSVARTLILLSLVLSSVSFILSLIALHLTKWKYIQLRSNSAQIIPSDHDQMDPLIRGEIDRYIDILYRHNQTHSFGLSSHCIVGTKCGQNLLPSFSEKDYSQCHTIKHYHQCIFPQWSLPSEKCACQKPSYVNTIHTMLIMTVVIEALFVLTNVLRLYGHLPCLNDIQLRLIAIISTLLSSIFLLVIIIQHSSNRLYEPLLYFETMREHYSHRQIYPFTHDVDLIIERITSSFDVQSGASYICIVLIFIFMIVSFFTSSTVEIKAAVTFDDEEKKIEHGRVLMPPTTTTERFVPYEQIRFPRQTKV